MTQGLGHFHDDKGRFPWRAHPEMFSSVLANSTRSGPQVKFLPGVLDSDLGLGDCVCSQWLGIVFDG